jgi:hypothetical protein
VISSNSSTS